MSSREHRYWRPLPRDLHEVRKFPEQAPSLGAHRRCPRGERIVTRSEDRVFSFRVSLARAQFQLFLRNFALHSLQLRGGVAVVASDVTVDVRR